jgi:hypothetical protein
MQLASPAERPLLLASAAAGEEPGRLADLPLGARDARVMALRERAFGARALATASCPACGALLEAELDLRAMREVTPSASEREVQAGGVRVRCRLPSTRDVLHAAAETDDARARALLLRACVVSAERGGAPVPPERLPEAALDAIANATEEGDPLADVQIALRCLDCANAWVAPFDIAEFLLAELRARAERLLREVHVLASAYGWTEREILSLSPWRRRTYLELVGR